jgi:hypothetical protein
MQANKKLSRTLGIIFFSIGILVGMAMFIFMNWAYFEATFFFGYTFPADKTLTTLRCPLVMTSSETGSVTASITNNTDRDLSILVRTEISYFGAATSERVTYPVAAGETRKLSWTVSSDNIVYGHLIMARVYVFGAYTNPSRTNTCHTMVVDLPGLTGIQIFIIVLALSLVCLMAGWGLWLAGSRPLQVEGLIATRAMSILTAVVLLGMFVGCIGWWGVGLICTVTGVLLTFTVVGYYIQKA